MIPEPTSPVAPLNHRRSLYTALGGTLFLRMGGGVMGLLTSVFLTSKNTELGSSAHPYYITATIAGIIIASIYLTELTGSFIAGGLIDRHGPRRYMMLGPLFGVVAMIGMAFLHLAPDSPPIQFVLFLGFMLCTRLLEGAAAATANPASLAFIAAFTSDDAKLRSRISGYFEIATLIGAIIGVVVGGFLWDRFGQAAFLLNGGVYLLSVAVFYNVPFVKAPAGDKPQEHNMKGYLTLVRSPRLRELIPAWLAISGILGILFNATVFQLSSGNVRGSDFGGGQIVRFADQTLSHAFGGKEVGIVFGIYAIAFGVGIVLWTQLIPRMRKSTAMLIAGGGTIVASILIALFNHTGPISDPSPERTVLIPLILIAVMIESGFTPAALVYLSDISELHPENRGMVMGLYSFLLGLGQLAGTIIVGPFADWRGVDGLLIFMAILAVCSIFGVILLRRDEQLTHEGITASASAGLPGMD